MNVDVSKSIQAGSSQMITNDVMQSMRAAIDDVSTVRARIGRCAVLAHILARPDPASVNDNARVARHVELLTEQAEDLDRLVRVLSGQGSDSDMPDAVAQLLANVARSYTGFARQMDQLAIATNALAKAAADHIASNRGELDKLERALMDHEKASRGLFPKITQFCSALWDAVDQNRSENYAQAQKAAKLIDETLARLEKIGKHVRLVSLNASVEASRAGEAGKGLAIIAVEFKALAEEIQTLSATARESIEST